MRDVIGIQEEIVVTEDLTGEGRAPFTPEQVKKLRDDYAIQVIVQPSPQRVFLEEEYKASGAKISDDLSECNIIFGVGQIPASRIRPYQTYCSFAGTAGPRRYDDEMIRRILESNSTLIDLGTIADSGGNRLISFGDVAGFAGMIDALWALGKRLDWEGIPSPFANVEQAYHYSSLEEAENAIIAVGQQIRAEGLPNPITPFVCAFTGKGQVSKAAQRMFNLLPTVAIRPDDLPTLAGSHSFSRNAVYRIEFAKSDLYQRISTDTPVASGDEPTGFDPIEFDKSPQLYEGQLFPYVNQLTMLINGVLWSSRHPRLLTTKQLRKLFTSTPKPRLRVISDIPCEVKGSLEFTVHTTTLDNPVFVYDPVSGVAIDGVAGNGPVVLANGDLAKSLPREASHSLGVALSPFLASLAMTDFSQPLDRLAIPKPFRAAVVAHQGRLTESFRYLNEYML